MPLPSAPLRSRTTPAPAFPLLPPSTLSSRSWTPGAGSVADLAAVGLAPVLLLLGRDGAALRHMSESRRYLLAGGTAVVYLFAAGALQAPSSLVVPCPASFSGGLCPSSMCSLAALPSLLFFLPRSPPRFLENPPAAPPRPLVPSPARPLAGPAAAVRIAREAATAADPFARAAAAAGLPAAASPAGGPASAASAAAVTAYILRDGLSWAMALPVHLLWMRYLWDPRSHRDWLLALAAPLVLPAAVIAHLGTVRVLALAGALAAGGQFASASQVRSAGQKVI